MRYMGIDYGSKRIGIALSDEAGNFAMPHSIVENKKGAEEKIGEIIKAQNVTEIILGESKDYKGADNKIMKQIREFKADIESRFNLPVHFETELLSSHQATHFQGKHELLDASAAAIILQSYLDTKKNKAN